MNKQKLGLILFLIGAVLIFAASWLAPWWTSPVWSSAPPEQFEETVWAAFGLIFTVISITAPIGILLITIGTLLFGEPKKSYLLPFIVGMIIIIFSFLFPATLGYYPVLFGISGGLILLFFYVVLWYWAKHHRMLNRSAKTASVYQLLGYVFFLLVALLMCALLGNPFSGLYFPEKVIEQNALPYHYAFGTKAVIYFVLGWFFTFLSHYKKPKTKS